MKWNEMKWNEKPIVPWRAKASSFEGQLNVYACDELFRTYNTCYQLRQNIFGKNTQLCKTTIQQFQINGGK